MSYLAKLKAATSKKDLAEMLGYKTSALTSIVYKIQEDKKYISFEIRKKSGGTRLIKAPCPKLKKLQSRLSHVLYQCLKEIEAERNLKAISFGFRKKRSIVDNATKHKRHRWVFNIDLKDFFPSINFGRVRGFFLKDKAFELHPDVATVIAQIACDGKALPQGSPASPIISELIGQILDMRLVSLAKKHKVTYSRYADDITFSTNEKEFPSALAIPDASDATLWHIGTDLLQKIEGAGFEVNKKKTRMSFRGSRQMVTGLIVNEKVNIKSDYYRRARAMCDALFQKGEYYVSSLHSNKEGEAPRPSLTKNVNKLEGILGFIYTITKHQDKRSPQDQRINPRAIRKLYRRFLFYKYFINLDKPLILTEGKTDPVYLKAAVRSRVKRFPHLGSLQNGKFCHAVRYFNYEGSAHEILDLGGGSGDLKSVPMDYLRNLHPPRNGAKAFKSIPMLFPIVMVLDSDDGVGPVASTIKKNFGVAFDWESTEDFYHITDNLYVVKTPEKSSKKTCIEDLFPEKWRKIKLKEKKFNPANKIDPDKEYSKEVFAKSVIKPNEDKIDFSGFDPLLERISKVLKDYEGRLKKV